jgi:ABC-type long-subunit fatty acid transport system fused permease/ATPase subunit
MEFDVWCLPAVMFNFGLYQLNIKPYKFLPSVIWTVIAFIYFIYKERRFFLNENLMIQVPNKTSQISTFCNLDCHCFYIFYLHRMEIFPK